MSITPGTWPITMTDVLIAGTSFERGLESQCIPWKTDNNFMKTVHCPQCNAEIGEEINVHGMIFLHVGALLLQEAKMICLQCGRRVYWSVSNKAIDLVVKAAMLSKSE
jgi:hypothetical protein